MQLSIPNHKHQKSGSSNAWEEDTLGMSYETRQPSGISAQKSETKSTKPNIKTKKEPILTSNKLWYFVYMTLTLWIPDKVFEKFGFKKEYISRFREKITYTLFYIISNSLLAYFIISSLLSYQNEMKNMITVPQLYKLNTNDLKLIYGRLYQSKDNDLSNIKLVTNNNILDSSFLYQTRDDICDSFWGVKGRGTYLPCFVVDFNNSTLIDLPKAGSKEQQNMTCLYEEGEIKSILKDDKILQLSYGDLKFNPYWVTYKGIVIDLSRLRYLHPNLFKGERKWFSDLSIKIRQLLDRIEYSNMDITYLTINELNNDQLQEFEKCIIKKFTIGRLAIFPYWTMLIYSISYAFGLMLAYYLLKGSLLYLYHSLFGINYIFKNDTIDSRVPKSYFHLKYKKNINKDQHTSWMDFVQLDQDSFNEEDLNNMILMEGSYPNTIKYNSDQFHKGVSHLAQWEPNYEACSNLDFDPIPILLLLNVNCRSDLEDCLDSLDSIASNPYPSTHKLIILTMDGQHSKFNKLLNLLKDSVLPVSDTKSSTYLSVGSPTKLTNHTKVYAGYYEYRFAGAAIETSIKIPLILVHKIGNSREQYNSSLNLGMRGIRDSFQMILYFLSRVHLNSPMTSFDYDIYNLSKELTGFNIKQYELILTMSSSGKLLKNALIDMIRPFSIDNEVVAVNCRVNLSFKSQLHRFVKAPLSHLWNFCNPTNLNNIPMDLKKICTIYRLYSPSNIVNAPPRYLLLDPTLLNSYAYPRNGLPDHLSVLFKVEWIDSYRLTHLLRVKLKDIKIIHIGKSYFQLNINEGWKPFIIFLCVEFLSFITIIWNNLFGRIYRGNFSILGIAFTLLFYPSVLSLFILIWINFIYYPLQVSGIISFAYLFLPVLITGIYIWILFIGSLCQSSSKNIIYYLGQVIFDTILAVVFLPVYLLFIPLLALWNFDEISNKHIFSSIWPNFNLTNNVKPRMNTGENCELINYPEKTLQTSNSTNDLEISRIQGKSLPPKPNFTDTGISFNTRSMAREESHDSRGLNYDERFMLRYRQEMEGYLDEQPNSQINPLFSINHSEILQVQVPLKTIKGWQKFQRLFQWQTSKVSSTIQPLIRGNSITSPEIQILPSTSNLDRKLIGNRDLTARKSEIDLDFIPDENEEEQEETIPIHVLHPKSSIQIGDLSNEANKIYSSIMVRNLFDSPGPTSADVIDSYLNHETPKPTTSRVPSNLAIMEEEPFEDINVITKNPEGEGVEDGFAVSLPNTVGNTMTDSYDNSNYNVSNQSEHSAQLQNSSSNLPDRSKSVSVKEQETSTCDQPPKSNIEEEKEGFVLSPKYQYNSLLLESNTSSIIPTSNPAFEDPKKDDLNYL